MPGPLDTRELRDYLTSVSRRVNRPAAAMRNHPPRMCWRSCPRGSRAAREWSQTDRAERLGLSRQTVNAVETGRYDPGLPLDFRNARLYGLAIEAVSLTRHSVLRSGGAPTAQFGNLFANQASTSSG